MLTFSDDGLMVTGVTDRMVEQVVVPGSVTGISDFAFSRCQKLERVVISEGVRELGN